MERFGSFSHYFASFRLRRPHHRRRRDDVFGVIVDRSTKKILKKLQKVFEKIEQIFCFILNARRGTTTGTPEKVAAGGGAAAARVPGCYATPGAGTGEGAGVGKGHAVT